MKLLTFAAAGLVLLAVEGVLVEALGLTGARPSGVIALVVFVATHGAALEGAFTAFALGYLLDVFSGRPTGLAPFLAMVAFVGARIATQVLDGRSRPGFVVFVAVSAAVQSLLAFLLTSLTARATVGLAASLQGLPAHVIWAALVAWFGYPLMKRVEPGERADPRALRL